MASESGGYVVLGGGIAGVTCAETLSILCPEERILLITSSNLIKAVTNLQKITKTLEVFDVKEKPHSVLENRFPNIKVIHGSIVNINPELKEVSLSDNSTIGYSSLCVCTGGTPKLINKENTYVLGIRDTESVKVFQEKLQNASRIAVVGNGGIATELVYEIEGCDVIWAVKDKSISSTFFDAGAAQFFLPNLTSGAPKCTVPPKRTKYSVESSGAGVSGRENTRIGSAPGSALGPDWSVDMHLKGLRQSSHQVHVEYECEIEKILTPQQFIELNTSQNQIPDWKQSVQDKWPVYILLTNGKLYGCDFVVSATGVIPNVQLFQEEIKFMLSDDGGIVVDDHMRTNLPYVYAAGDVCTASWEFATHWFQMRLWCQARQMGAYAAKCMIADEQKEEIHQDFCFELFAHVTKFFGYKVVLLGKYNGQGLGKDYEMLLRVTKGVEYVKVILHKGRMYGAILVGDTDLEETFENLILNQMDLSMYGEDLLNPTIDIEDYFD